MRTTLKIVLISAALGFASASSAGPLLQLVASETRADLKAIDRPGQDLNIREAGATAIPSP